MTLTRDILRAAQAVGIEPEDIAHVCDWRRRHPASILQREGLVVWLRDNTRMSYPEIAMALGSPNSSTVITAHKRARVRAGEEKANG